MINKRSQFINNNVSLLKRMKYDNIYESSPISLEKVGVNMARSNNSKSTNSRRSCDSKSNTRQQKSRSNSSSKTESKTKTSRN